MPVDAFPSLNIFGAAAAMAVGKLFLIGLMLAAPVVIALIVTDAALALVSRAVPQMNVFQIGTQAKILLGFGILAASLPFVAVHVRDDLSDAVVTALTVLSGG
jgi:flagellar biosynthetic protein FliR